MPYLTGGEGIVGHRDASLVQTGDGLVVQTTSQHETHPALPVVSQFSRLLRLEVAMHPETRTGSEDRQQCSAQLDVVRRQAERTNPLLDHHLDRGHEIARRR